MTKPRHAWPWPRKAQVAALQSQGRGSPGSALPCPAPSLREEAWLQRAPLGLVASSTSLFPCSSLAGPHREHTGRRLGVLAKTAP